MTEQRGFHIWSSFSISFASSRLFEASSAWLTRSYRCEWKHKFPRKHKNSQPGHHLVFISYTQSNSIQSKSKSLKAPVYQIAVGKDRVPHSQAPPRLWPMIWILLSHTRRYSHTSYSPTQNFRSVHPRNGRNLKKKKKSYITRFYSIFCSSNMNNDMKRISINNAKSR